VSGALRTHVLRAGMMGMLMRNETDATAMTMSIRTARMAVVDFSHPIANNLVQLC
jgi:hypothetical protein